MENVNTEYKSEIPKKYKKEAKEIVIEELKKISQA